MHILINTIPHEDQGYETTGNWSVTPGGGFVVEVSQMSNKDYEFLVAVHELIEAYLATRNGVGEDAVTKFDMAFEAKRRRGNTDEPGDDPKAPYRDEHFFATSIERLLAQHLGVDWLKYEEANEKLYG